MRDGFSITNNMTDNIEQHIFRVLEPISREIVDDYQKINIRTANLVDYCSYMKKKCIDLSDILFDGVKVIDFNKSNSDAGQTYVIVVGSMEHAMGLMRTFANNFNMYLEKNSKSKYYPKFNYQLIN